jgi:hypothetical protein
MDYLIIGMKNSQCVHDYLAVGPNQLHRPEISPEKGAVHPTQ